MVSVLSYFCAAQYRLHMLSELEEGLWTLLGLTVPQRTKTSSQATELSTDLVTLVKQWQGRLECCQVCDSVSVV